jgi:hypothetical protein
MANFLKWSNLLLNVAHIVSIEIKEKKVILWQSNNAHSDVILDTQEEARKLFESLFRQVTKGESE